MITDTTTAADKEKEKHWRQLGYAMLGFCGVIVDGRSLVKSLVEKEIHEKDAVQLTQALEMAIYAFARGVAKWCNDEILRIEKKSPDVPGPPVFIPPKYPADNNAEAKIEGLADIARSFLGEASTLLPPNDTTSKDLIGELNQAIQNIENGLPSIFQDS